MSFLVWMLPLVLAVSWGLAGLIRRYALSRELLDIPNGRSSHVVPTPRGAGLAIVIAVSAALLVLWPLMGYATLMAFLVGGGMVAAVGWLDDHQHVSARWRFLGHLIAAGWMLSWLGGLPSLNVPGLGWLPGWGWQVLGLLLLVWLLNLYNFMDGIDGLAGVEAVSLGIYGGLICWLAGEFSLAIVPFSLAAAALGFLVWNWPPARVFMGDVGSGYIGILIGGFAVHAASLDERLFWSWLILAGVFVVDATFTLFQRLVRGERVYEAHRSHAYQYAARRWGSHRRVTAAVAVINTFWLLPVALLVAKQHTQGFVGLILAYCPLVFVAMYFRAGNRKAQEETEIQ